VLRLCFMSWDKRSQKCSICTKTSFILIKCCAPMGLPSGAVVTRDSGFESRLCHSQPQPGDPWGSAQLAQCHLGKGRVWLAGMSLSHRALVTPFAGGAQCTLTRLPGARYFVWHISVAGFRVNLCLSRVRTGVAVMRQHCNYQLARKCWCYKIHFAPICLHPC
jgi:hypothetical protein